MQEIPEASGIDGLVQEMLKHERGSLEECDAGVNRGPRREQREHRERQTAQKKQRQGDCRKRCKSEDIQMKNKESPLEAGILNTPWTWIPMGVHFCKANWQ